MAHLCFYARSGNSVIHLCFYSAISLGTTARLANFKPHIASRCFHTHAILQFMLYKARLENKFSNVLRWPMKLRKQLRIDVFPPLHPQG